MFILEVYGDNFERGAWTRPLLGNLLSLGFITWVTLKTLKKKTTWLREFNR